METDIQTVAVRLLARREHSRYELMQKLLLRQFQASAITLVLDHLVKKNWQSDERFAEHYVRSALSKGYGALKIQAGLRERGIPAAMIAEALSKVPDVWLTHIQKVWQKKFGTIVEYGSLSFMKQQRFLQSRGFMGEDIKRLWAILYEK